MRRAASGRCSLTIASNKSASQFNVVPSTSSLASLTDFRIIVALQIYAILDVSVEAHDVGAIIRHCRSSLRWRLEALRAEPIGHLRAGLGLNVEYRDITSEGLLRASSFKGLSRK